MTWMIEIAILLPSCLWKLYIWCPVYLLDIKTCYCANNIRFIKSESQALWRQIILIIFPALVLHCKQVKVKYIFRHLSMKANLEYSLTKHSRRAHSIIHCKIYLELIAWMGNWGMLGNQLCAAHVVVLTGTCGKGWGNGHNPCISRTFKNRWGKSAIFLYDSLHTSCLILSAEYQ